MKWLRGRDESQTQSGESLDAMLEEAQGRSWSGCIDIDSLGQTAHVYLYEGSAYACDLGHYTPRIAARMKAAGWIDEAAARELEDEYGPASTQAGTAAVERGLVDAEHLGQLHQEYLLASLGALRAAHVDAVRRREGITTDRLCTIPIEAGPLLETLELRAGRLGAATQALGADVDPSATTLTATGVVPGDLQVPEVVAVHAAALEGASADGVARALGLSRAEAVYILAALSARGLVNVGGHAGPIVDEDLAVPEAFATATSTR